MPSTTLTGLESSSIQRKVADCVVNGRVGLARRVLAESNIYTTKGGLHGGAPAKVAKDLKFGDCLGEAVGHSLINFRWMSLRLAINDGLYRKEFPNLPQRNWSGVRPVGIFLTGEEPQDSYAKAAGTFGVCVAKSDPQSVDAFVRQIAESQAEADALERVKPILAPCLTSGLTMKLNRATLRMVLLDAMWRLANGRDTQTAQGVR